MLHARVDTESHQGIRHLVGDLGLCFQPLQGRNHVASVSQLSAGHIGPVFPEAGELHDDGAGGYAEDNFCHDHHDVVTETQAAATVTTQEAVDHITHHTGGKNHKGVYHALDQAEGHHVAVGHVANFMGQHRADFLGAKTA